MEVVEILSRMAAAASDAWINAPEGPDKEVMGEVADALRDLAEAKLQTRQPEGSKRVRSLIVHVTENPEEP